MAEEPASSSSSIPVVPLGALGAAAAIALAGAVYAISSRNTDERDSTPAGETAPKTKSAPKGKSGGGVRKRLGLMSAIAIIENDTTRKLLLATLKAMAKRA